MLLTFRHICKVIQHKIGAQKKNINIMPPNRANHKNLCVKVSSLFRILNKSGKLYFPWSNCLSNFKVSLYLFSMLFFSCTSKFVNSFRNAVASWAKLGICTCCNKCRVISLDCARLYRRTLFEMKWFNGVFTPNGIFARALIRNNFYLIFGYKILRGFILTIFIYVQLRIC